MHAAVDAHFVRRLTADRSRVVSAVDSWASGFLYSSYANEEMLGGDVVPELMAMCPATRAVIGACCGANDESSMRKGVVHLAAMTRLSSRATLGNWMDYLGDVWASAGAPAVMIKLLTTLGLAVS